MAIVDPVAETRADLAAALRWAAKLGLHEGICNHFSCLVPGARDKFLINPQGVHWAEVTASKLLVVDFAGRLIEGTAPPEPTALFIHARIHRGAPHARAILHTHMPYATAITLLDDGRLEPVSQTAMGLYKRIAYDDQYSGLALDDREGDRMLAALGKKDILFLANHGVLITGPSIHVAFDDLYYLERAAQLQWLACSYGRKLRRVSDNVVAMTAQQFGAMGESQSSAHFAALKRLLEPEKPDYRA